MNYWEQHSLNYLRVLISKYQEQTDIGYRRLSFFITLITIFVGAIISFISTRFDSKLLWAIPTFICLIGVAVSCIWWKLIKITNYWIEFWRAKIYAFENSFAPDNPLLWYMLERKTTKEDLLERLNKCNTKFHLHGEVKGECFEYLNKKIKYPSAYYETFVFTVGVLFLICFFIFGFIVLDKNKNSESKALTLVYDN